MSAGGAGGGSLADLPGGSAPWPRQLVLLGHPVAQSLSPRMHGAALRAAGIDAPYEALDVPPATLADALARLGAARAGGNVTIPHKRTVWERCDVRTATAAAVGAVNTFWHASDGALVGDNTDVDGIAAAARALTRERPVRRVTLIGAGGSAAAAAFAIGTWGGATVALWNRSVPPAQALAQRFACVRVAKDLPSALEGTQLVIHATPVGMRDDEVPFDVAALPPGSAVLDLVYRIGATALVRSARAAGHEAADGTGVLVEQGAAAFRRWFGTEPDRAAMWRAVTSGAP